VEQEISSLQDELEKKNVEINLITDPLKSFTAKLRALKVLKKEV
jgi:hypothetical protein